MTEKLLTGTLSLNTNKQTIQPEGKNIPVHFSYSGRRPSVKLKQQNCSHVRGKKETVSLTETQPIILDLSPTQPQDRNPRPSQIRQTPNPNMTQKETPNLPFNSQPSTQSPRRGPGRSYKRQLHIPTLAPRETQTPDYLIPNKETRLH